MMARRKRLKAAATPMRTHPVIQVYDRRATDLPVNAKVRLIEVDDPLARGDRITAIASIRDDPLGAMHARSQVNEAQYHAGRHWQRLYEECEIGARGMDIMKEPVDGGGGSFELLIDRRMRAAKKLTRCCAVLGQEGDALIRDVLGRGFTVGQSAAARGLSSARELAYLGIRFRECLETLANELGYA